MLMCHRITEEILHESIDARTQVLPDLRELGPPDLIQLIKQAARNPVKQVRANSCLVPDTCSSYVEWCIPSYYRRGCLLIGKSCSVYQYSDIQRDQPVDVESCGGTLLVGYCVCFLTLSMLISTAVTMPFLGSTCESTLPYPAVSTAIVLMKGEIRKLPRMSCGWRHTCAAFFVPTRTEMMEVEILFEKSWAFEDSIR